MFSGVYREIQDLVLADVDRIEIIHGSGSTLWGANAVNGVILDPKALQQIRLLESQSGKPILNSVVTRFLDGWETTRTELLRAIGASDGTALFQAAHSL